MIPKINRDFIRADLSAVNSLLKEMSGRDIVARYNLEKRRVALAAELSEAENRTEPMAVSAIFFTGEPVFANRGIDSKFGGAGISKYQEIISMMDAIRNRPLGERGVVPGQAKSKLHVTGVVHGSFGFQFEEIPDQTVAFDSHLKESVDKTTKVLQAFAEPNDESYADAVADIDARVLDSIREFFSLITDHNAEFRMVSGDVDQDFNRESILRASDRLHSTKIDEFDQSIVGILSGYIAHNRQFEYTSADVAGGYAIGRVDPMIPDVEAARMLDVWHKKDSNALMHIRQIVRQGKPPRSAYFLKELSERND